MGTLPQTLEVPGASNHVCPVEGDGASKQLRIVFAELYARGRPHFRHASGTHPAIRGSVEEDSASARHTTN